MTTLKPKSEMIFRDRLALALELILFFCRIGCFTFGGGWSLIAQMQKEFVDKRRWMKEEDLLDMVAVGRSLPGTMIGNVSYLFGYQLGGILCGVAATIGMLIMPVLILSIVTVFYNSFRDNIYVARAMVGVRATVAPIIGNACLTMRKSAYQDKIGYLLTIIALALCLFTPVSNVLIVLAGAAAGLLLMEMKQRRKADGSMGKEAQ